MHVADTFAAIERARDTNDDEDGPPRFREEGFDPPSRDVLEQIPWRGEGPDPLGGS